MKKILLIAALAVGCAVIMSAQENKPKGGAGEEKPPKPLNEWTFFQIGFLPGFPGATKYSNVYGLKLGAPMVDGDGRVYGIEPSGLYSGTNYVNGIQAAWFGLASAKEVQGLQACIGATITDKVWGVQAAILNIAQQSWGFQPGGVNIIKDGKGIEGSLVNVSETYQGLQFGGVNITDNLKGFQASACNITKYTKGLQFGLFNYSSEGAAQLGVINIIEDSPIPFMPIFNYHYGKD